MKLSTRLALLGTGILCLITVVGCPNPSNETTGASKLQGGGSTFVGPMMDEWKKTYKKDKGVEIGYTLGGSGAGIQNMVTGDYDFGCTDAFMTDEELKSAKGEVLHIPLVLGALAMAYKLDGLPQLKLTGPVLADIYLGKITKWNDKAIADLNPGVDLPDQKVVPVRRSDPSGSTFIFTTYLSQVSEDWKTQVGTGTEVKWPAASGEGAKGTGAVAKLVESTPGAIGYMEVTYAQKNKTPFAALQNRKGQFISGDNIEAVTAAAEAAEKDIPDHLRFVLTNAEGEQSYPLCGVVWAVAYSQQPKDKAQPVADFFRWVLKDGQDMAAKLNYARLPASLVAKVEKQVDKIKAAP